MPNALLWNLGQFLLDACPCYPSLSMRSTIHRWFGVLSSRRFVKKATTLHRKTRITNFGKSLTIFPCPKVSALSFLSFSLKDNSQSCKLFRRPSTSCSAIHSKRKVHEAIQEEHQSSSLHPFDKPVL